MKDALREAEKALDAEMTKQVDMIYSAMALALKRYWGWGKRRTLALMEETDKVWGECSGTNKKSMIQMLEEETGIEIRNHEQGKSWHDLAFLNADIDMRRMTRAQWIYMRQKQKDWIGPQVVACVLLALYRKHKFGHVRSLRLLEQIQEIEREYNLDPIRLKQQCLDEADIIIKGGDDDGGGTK